VLKLEQARIAETEAEAKAGAAAGTNAVAKARKELETAKKKATEATATLAEAEKTLEGKAATAYKPEWFYAGCLIVVGAHYLPFITLYGQPIFGAAGVLMAAAGILLPRFRPGEFATGGWLGAAMLAVLGIVLGAAHVARPRTAHSP